MNDIAVLRMLLSLQGKLSNGSNYIAGMGAGVLEAVFAVTPSETISECKCANRRLNFAC